MTGIRQAKPISHYLISISLARTWENVGTKQDFLMRVLCEEVHSEGEPESPSQNTYVPFYCTPIDHLASGIEVCSGFICNCFPNNKSKPRRFVVL